MHAYTVRHGDSLYSIAQKFDIRAAALARFNSLNTADNLYIGQVLLIPVRIIRYRPSKGQTPASVLHLFQAESDTVIMQPEDSDNIYTFYFDE